MRWIKTKVGIITFHFVYNSGAVLQCLALQTALETMGHQVQIINYRPKYQTKNYRLFKDPFYEIYKVWKETKGHSILLRIYRMIRRYAGTVLSFSQFTNVLKQRKGFTDFCERYLNEGKAYYTIEQLVIDPPDVDVLISGSDQLWNPTLTNYSLDKAYFLDFGRNFTKKIAYAVGTSQLDLQKYKKDLDQLLRNFDVISLREYEKKNTLEKIYEKSICVAPDPTMLLNAKDYIEFEEKIQEEEGCPFVLVYIVSDKDINRVYTVAEKVATALKLTIIDISPVKKHGGTYIPRNGIGPGKFLSYIHNASFIVTNSFHATVFSILNKKNFLVVPHMTRSDRIQELLNYLNLDNRFLTNRNAIELCNENIDYEIVNDKLSLLKQSGLDFLNNAIKKMD